jgi:hypothetical protein
MAQNETIFADGFVFKRNEKAPDFVVGRLSIKVDEAVAFIREHNKNGWANLNIKQARSGNYYIELDTFEPSAKSAEKTVTTALPPKMKGDMANQFNETFDAEEPPF